MNKFIFDVDGTLTPSRKGIDKKFAVWFSKFCEREKVYIVTGSDRPKTIEQVGEVIYNKCRGVYQCSGNDVYSAGVRIRKSDWETPEEVKKWLSDELIRSPFPVRTGNHLEERPGTANFSVVGRNANKEQRAQYVKYDTTNNERNQIVETFNYNFGEKTLGLMATAGGDTGIDLYPIGFDKSQVILDFSNHDTVHFFGDKMDPGGNDYPLAQVNKNGVNHHVRDWQHTWEILKCLQ
jgi:phosphomannomutase